MQAIETRYIPATNTKPRRIVAETASGIRLVMSEHAASDLAGNSGRDDDTHRVVATALRDKLGWPTGRLYCGSTKRGLVFVSEHDGYKNA